MRKNIFALSVPQIDSRKSAFSRASTKTFTVFAFAAILGLALVQYPANAFQPLVTATTGSGSNESYLVLNFDDGPSGANNSASNFVFGYDWSSVGPAPNAYTMLTALSSVGLTTNATYYASFGEHLIDTFSFGTASQTDEYYTTGQSWNFWQSSASALAANPTDPNDWVSPAYGVDDQILADGSYTGFVFDTSPPPDYTGATPIVPTSAPAPELSSLASLSLCFAVIFVLSFATARRKKTAIKLR